MLNDFVTILKAPFAAIALIIGAAFLGIPFVKYGEGSLSIQEPTSPLPLWIGIAFSALGITLHLWNELGKRKSEKSKIFPEILEIDGGIAAKIGECEIRIVFGKIEKFSCESDCAVVLPCNEYFDANCVDDKKSALGAYVNHAFPGRVLEFPPLVLTECAARLHPQSQQQKNEDETSTSYGAGRSVLLMNPLSHPTSIALVSTSTQRHGQGINARLTFLSDGVRELVSRLADARFSSVVMPILGAGHGGISAQLALVGLLTSLAEVAKFGLGNQKLKAVTIVVFQRDAASKPEVEREFAKAALALMAHR